MTISTFRLAAAAAAATLTLAGCLWSGPSRIEAPAIDASAAGAAAIAQYDKNKDGKLAANEIPPSIKSAILQIDLNGDKAVTADEITARINQWQDSKVGRMQILVQVTRNGRPLEGADVKLVPEKFLGENVPVGTGKSNDSGYADVSAPAEQADGVRGMPPGLYRVEITMPGANIDKLYNTQTMYGMEVAQDAPILQEGARFDVQF